MTLEAFTTHVTIHSRRLMDELEGVQSAIATAACLEACYNLAINAGREKEVATKMRQIADLLEPPQ